MQPVASPSFSSKELLNIYARQLSAKEGINMEKFGVDKYNDFGWGLLDVFVYGFTAMHVDLRNDDDFSAEKMVLRKMNEAVHSQLTNQKDLHKSNLCQVRLNKSQVMEITRVRQGLATGLKISIGDDSVFIADLHFEGLKEKLELQTVGHTFSRQVSVGLDNPGLLAQGLAKARTFTGVEVVTKSKTIDGKRVNFVVPTIERQNLPPFLPGVAIHIGNNYIAGPNTLKHVDDGATVAYVADMAVMTVVDGYSSTAKHECSRVHSANISTAALLTMKEYREGRLTTELELEAYFKDQLKALYKSTPMPDRDTGVTFACGVTYLGRDGKLKLISFGLSSAMFVSVTNDGSVTQYHVQQEGDKCKPFVSSTNFRDLDKLCKAKMWDVSENTTKFMLGTDGCFSEYCERVPRGYDQSLEVLDLTCKNLPVDGKISPHFTDEDRLRTSYKSNDDKRKAASKKCDNVLAVPTLIARELKIEPPSKFLNQESAASWNALENMDEQTLPEGLKMPKMEAVNQLRKERDILSQFASAGIKADTKLSEFIQVVTEKEGDQEVKSLQLKQEMKDNPAAQLLLIICEMALKKRSDVFKINAIEKGNADVDRVVTLATTSINALISKWKTLIQEPADSDQEWRALETEAGRKKYKANFGKPSVETIANWKKNWREAVLEYNELSINIKATAGDDFAFVIVDAPPMMQELRKRMN